MCDATLSWHIITGVARPPRTHGQGTMRGRKPMGSFWLGALFPFGAPGHCPPCSSSCHAPAHHLAERLRRCQEHILLRRSQWRTTNLASCCLEQMDVPESSDVGIDVMPPIALWNMIVSAVVLSWRGQEFTTLAVLPG